MFGKLGDLFGSKKKPASKPPVRLKTPAPILTPTPAAKLRRTNLKRRFSILAETGKGSMSRIYRALDTESGRVVCLKVQDRKKTDAALARGSQVDRPTEGEIGVALNHPNIVRTYEFGLSSRGEYYVSMEYVDGFNLQEYRQSRVFDLSARVELLAQAAEGLAAVHDRGFIHHDFGPKNVLIDPTDRVKIIDFGLAVPNTAAFRRPGNRTGTLNYMAPELLRREPTDQRIDIFSFGATAFELLTGRLPYDDAITVTAMTQRINQEPLDPAQVNPSLPASLCDILRHTLARRPDDRWPKMATLPEALRHAANSI